VLLIVKNTFILKVKPLFYANAFTVLGGVLLAALFQVFVELSLVFQLLELGHQFLGTALLCGGEKYILMTEIPS